MAQPRFQLTKRAGVFRIDAPDIDAGKKIVVIQAAIFEGGGDGGLIDILGCQKVGGNPLNQHGTSLLDPRTGRHRIDLCMQLGKLCL